MSAQASVEYKGRARYYLSGVGYGAWENFTFSGSFTAGQVRTVKGFSEVNLTLMEVEFYQWTPCVLTWTNTVYAPVPGTIRLTLCETSPPPVYARFTLQNNSAATVALGCLVYTTGSYYDTGTGLLGPGQSQQVCLGPYTNIVGTWLWYHPDFIISNTETGLENTATNETVKMGSGDWKTTCAASTPTLIVYPPSADMNDGINWSNLVAGANGFPTNSPLPLNTNLTNQAAILQLGFGQVVGAINGLASALTNGGGAGGDVIVTNQVNFDQITNYLATISKTSSNELWLATNRNAGTFSGWGDLSSNSIFAGALTFSNDSYASFEDIASAMGGVPSVPDVGEALPNPTFSFPGVGAYAIPLNIPWEGGAPVSESNISWSGSMWGWMRTILSVVLVLSLWGKVYSEILESWWKVMHTHQMQLLKGDVLGTSIALPWSFAVGAIIIAVMVVLPAALVGWWVSHSASTVGTVAAAMGTITTVGASSGVFGLVKLVAPWELGVACLSSYVAWRFYRDAATGALSAFVKGFMAD